MPYPTDAIRPCYVCHPGWNRVHLDAIEDPLRFRIYCESCSAETGWSEDVVAVIAEWRERWEKAEAMRNPTPEFWAGLYGGE